MIAGEEYDVEEGYYNIDNHIDGYPCMFCTQHHYYIKIHGAGNVNSSDVSGCFINRFEICSSDIKWIYNTGDWNEYYDKSNNKKIISILNKFFKQYEERRRMD